MPVRDAGGDAMTMMGLCVDCALRQSIERHKADGMVCAARGPDGKPDPASTCGQNRRRTAEAAARRKSA